jgi:methylated-DNA-protein-cysteine methyltransferase-like protein
MLSIPLRFLFHRHRIYIALNPAATLFSCSFPRQAAWMTHAFSCNLAGAGDRAKMSWDRVYRHVQQIPRGRVLTYGALAKALRLPGGARAAGRAMGATPSGKGIPWHPVVGERGKILIREPYASLQRKLLESEGVNIIESHVDLKRHLWKSPQKTAPKRKAPRRRARK